MANFIEIKFFQHTVESLEFKKLNEGDVITPCSLFKVTVINIDFDKIVAYYPHCMDDNVTCLDVIEVGSFNVPMKYERFNEFYKSKMVTTV